MANHLRRQIRDAAVSALTGLATTGARVFDSRVYPVQDAELPGLCIFTNNEDVHISSMGVSRLLERDLELVVEACVKENDSFDNTADQIIKEVETALAGGLTGAKYVSLKRIEIEMVGDGEKPIALARMIFDAPYITAVGAPDVAF